MNEIFVEASILDPRARSNDPEGVALLSEETSKHGDARCARRHRHRDASRRRGSRDRVSLSLFLPLSLFLGPLLSVRVPPALVESSTWHQREDIQRGGRLFPAKRRRPSLVVARSRARFREIPLARKRRESRHLSAATC